MANTDPSPTAAALPPGVWLHIIKKEPLETQHGLLALVCKAWRSYVLEEVDDMLVILGSGRGAVSFGVWLRAHGHRVKVLKVTDHFFLGTGAQWASRLADTHRIALLQGLQAGGRPLPLLSNLRICLDQLTAADAVCLGFINAPQLTSLELNSSGSTIGVTGAQGLAPLTGLRKLIVPTQGLGDQGLRIISSSLNNLQHINLHNDGHVTDEGLPFLVKLTSLTALDLQGSISITNHGMLAVSKSLPQLQELNISWCAGVNDWGLAQLCHLSNLSNLSLEATDIRLESGSVRGSLTGLSNLTHLNLNRCAVQAAGLAAVAEATTGLQCLKLSQNSALTSFGDLRVLKQLSSLTFLDVSAPSALVHPDWHLTALFELTQLQELVATDLWKAADGDQSTSSLYPPLPTAAEMAASAFGDGDGQEGLPFVVSDTAASGPASFFHHHQQQQEEDETGAAPAASVGAASDPATAGGGHAPADSAEQDHSSFWWKALEQLACMSKLTSLDFRFNLPGQLMLAVLLVRGLAQVTPRPKLHTLQVSLYEAKDCRRFRSLAGSLRAQGPFLDTQVYRERHGLMDNIHDYAMASVGRPLADSIDLQQLDAFCKGQQPHLEVAGGEGQAASSNNDRSSSRAAGGSTDEQGELPLQQQAQQEASQLELAQKAMQLAKLCAELRSVETPAGARGRTLSDVKNFLQESPPSETKDQGLSALSLIQLLLPSFKVLVGW